MKAARILETHSVHLRSPRHLVQQVPVPVRIRQQAVRIHLAHPRNLLHLVRQVRGPARTRQRAVRTHLVPEQQLVTPEGFRPPIW